MFYVPSAKFSTLRIKANAGLLASGPLSSVKLESKYTYYFKLIEAEWHIYVSVNLPSLVQIMACHLVGAKPLSEKNAGILLIQWSFYQNSHIFIQLQENALEKVVSKKAAILSRPQSVKQNTSEMSPVIFMTAILFWPPRVKICFV